MNYEHYRKVMRPWAHANGWLIVFHSSSQRKVHYLHFVKDQYHLGMCLN